MKPHTKKEEKVVIIKLTMQITFYKLTIVTVASDNNVPYSLQLYLKI